MAALSAVVFTLSWWLGLYLLARSAKTRAGLAATGLCGFALVVALDAVRVVSVAHAGLLSQIEIYLVAVPGWPGSRSCSNWRARRDLARRATELSLVAVVAAATLVGAGMAGVSRAAAHRALGDVRGDLLRIHPGALVAAVRRRSQPVSVVGVVVVATLFFALGNAVLIIPLGLVPSWLALASTGFDVLLLGVAVALWDAFDEGQALRADMLRSFAGTVVVAVLFGGQALLGMAVTGGTVRAAPRSRCCCSPAWRSPSPSTLADPLAGLLDRLAFSRSRRCAPTAPRCAAQAALPLRATRWTDLDDDTFARLTRRALGHYGDLSARRQPADPAAGDRRATGRPRATDQPLERANELKGTAGRPHRPAQNRADGGEFGTTEQWRYYNSLYFPYVVGSAPTRRTPPPPAWIRWRARPGSGSSPRCRSAPCTTGRTRRPVDRRRPAFPIGGRPALTPRPHRR